MASVSVDGVALHVAEVGEGEPLVLLHGFTGSGAQWVPLAGAMAGERRCIMVDLLGHGESDAPENPERYGMARCLSDLEAILDHLRIERTDLLGYSMGGRIALAFALARPDRIRTLILEGASPGITDAGERAARVAHDARWADLLERDGIEAFADAWMRQPLFASQTCVGPAKLAEERRRRCANKPVGLANSLRGIGTGAQQSFWERLPELAVSTLLIVGEEDEKFRNIAADMATRIPRVGMRIIPEAGHATHLEHPAAFEGAVREFLRRNRGRDERWGGNVPTFETGRAEPPPSPFLRKEGEPEPPALAHEEGDPLTVPPPCEGGG
jgi:2-succinyl-6-hydroxy-2,4-cyclohexadiene-1-carboxylate synthase